MRFLATLPLFILLLAGCKKPLKDMMDYYPRIETVSAVVQPDGSVRVTARITDQGGSDIVSAGFCASTSPTPEMLDAQALGSVSGDMVTAVYTGFSTTGTYYFRSWVTNDHGYTYGNIIALSDIEPEPVVAPCTPNMNQVILGGGLMTQNYSQISMPSGYMGVWQFTALSSAHNFTYRVGGALSTRIYTTTTSNDPPVGQIRIGFFSGFTNASIHAGQSVYVNQLSPTQWEFVVCGATWGSGSGALTTRFLVNG